MLSFHILSILIFMPIISMFLIAFLSLDNKAFSDNNIKNLGVFVSFFEFIFSLFLMLSYRKLDAGYQFIEKKEILSSLGFNYFLGVDGISILFIVLNALVFFIINIFSNSFIKNSLKEITIAMLGLQGFLVGVFASLDVILLFLFLELSFFVFYCIFYFAKQTETEKYQGYLLINTIGSSFFIVFIIVWSYLYHNSSLIILQGRDNIDMVNYFLWFAILFWAVIKIGMFPFHGYVIKFLVNSLNITSILHFAIITKMVIYVIIRLMLTVFPLITNRLAPIATIFAMFTIFYILIISFANNDIKKRFIHFFLILVATSFLGIFSFNAYGLSGAIIHMVYINLIVLAVFTYLTFLYENYKSFDLEQIHFYGGQNFYKLLFLLLLATSLAPGSIGFISMFLISLSIFQYSIINSLIFLFSCILFVWSVFAVIKNLQVLQDVASEVHYGDIKRKQALAVLFIVGLIVFFGIMPFFIFDLINLSTDNIMYLFYDHINIMRNVPKVIKIDENGFEVDSDV